MPTPYMRQVPASTAQRPPRFILKVGFVFLAVLFFLWLAFFGWLRDNPQLHGDASPRLQEAVQSYMDEVTNFRLSLSERSLAGYLMSVLPEYEHVAVDVPLFDNTVNVTATRKPATYTWQANGRRYDISADGVVLQQQQTDTSDNLTIIDNSSLEYEVGNRVATPSFLRFMRQLDQALADSYTPVSLRIDGSTQYVVATLEEHPFQLRLSPDIKPTAQVATLNDLLSMLEQQGSGQPQEYVDTRVPGRVFWQ